MKDFTRAPIFIFSESFKQSSILSWSLGQHPNLIILPETEWIFHLSYLAQFLYNKGTQRSDLHLSSFGTSRENFLLHIEHMTHKLIQDSFKQFVNQKQAEFLNSITDAQSTQHLSHCWIRSWNDPKTRWISSAPRTIYVLPYLNQLFPTAHFIFLLQHPLEHLDPTNAQHETTLQKCIKFSRLCLNARNHLPPNKILTTFHHDLIFQTESELQKIFQFIGEDFHPFSLLPIQELHREKKEEKEKEQEKERQSDKNNFNYERNKEAFSSHELYSVAVALYHKLLAGGSVSLSDGDEINFFNVFKEHLLETGNEFQFGEFFKF